ncbi:MAG TPA: DUF3883 domain-containing protein [Lacunisphaera sp.]|jgi:hypothetical protein|nr:DUF3883 domain-containing protein [Lacunisphaera sp.]
MADISDRTPWSQVEVQAIAAVYFNMLQRHLAGEHVSKADENRKLRQIIKRSQSSIERKHSNISAVLVELGYVYLSGYKPLPHYQKLLKTEIEDWLVDQTGLDSVATAFVEKPAVLTEIEGVLPVQVPPPKAKKPKPYDARAKEPRAVFRKNFLEQEARNASLGLAGEELMLKFEHRKLWEAGQHKLADRIEHVSKTKGDGLGFDILSFDLNGRERLIEVKTTRLGPFTPFYVSRNEVTMSSRRKEEYQLFRVFDFGEKPRFFALDGSIRDTCLLEPLSFSALPG